MTNTFLSLRQLSNIIFVGVLFGLPSCQSSTQEAEKTQLKAYFKEIVLGNEWQPARKHLSKWQQSLYVYPMGDFSPALKEELSNIIEELAALTSLSFHWAEDSTLANCLIFAGRGRDFCKLLAPQAHSFLKKNKGLFLIDLAKDKSIVKARIWIDTSTALDVRVQKHLLREEFTQALGLVNDSWKYKKSIFYQGWTRTQQYSTLDQALIKKLYQPQLKAGMTWEEIEGFF